MTRLPPLPPLPPLFAVILALATVLVSSDVWADEEGLNIDAIDRIGIDDLIDVAIRSAPTLARAKADVDVARGEARAASGVDDWELTLGLTATRLKSAPVDGQPVQVTNNEQYDGNLGLRRSLPTGGELTLGLQASRTKEEFRVEEMAVGSEPRTSNSSATRTVGRASLTHPLLRGVGRSIARAELEQAKIAMSAGELRSQARAGELIRDVIEAYWELVHAAISLEIRRSSLKTATEVLKETRLAVRKGDRARTDLQSAEYAVAVREESVLQAEIAVRETALSLRRISGLEIGPDSIALWPADLPDVGKKRFSLAKSVRRGMRSNPGLRAIVFDGKAASIDVRVAKNRRRPRLDVVVSGSASSTGPNFDAAVSTLSDSNEYEISAGFSFSFDIGNNAAKGAHAVAVGRGRSTRIGIEELRRDVASAIVLTVHRIRAGRKRAQVASKAMALAVANLRAERARFQAGRASSRDLYERQGEIDDASLSRARAVADYHQAVAQLRALTGEILPAHNVTVLK